MGLFKYIFLFIFLKVCDCEFSIGGFSLLIYGFSWFGILKFLVLGNKMNFVLFLIKFMLN